MAYDILSSVFGAGTLAAGSGDAAAVDHEAVWTAIAGVLVVLGGALLAGAIFERLKQSAILGYLLAGTLLGPNAIALVGEDQRHMVEAMAELGVALLLFAIGLEFSVRRLLRMGKLALGGGGGQVLATTAAAGLIWWAFTGNGRAAVAVGAILAMSSTACVLRVLMDRAAIDSMYGRGSLAVLLMQDAAVVPLVLLVSLMAAGGSMGAVMIGVVRSVIFIVALVGAFWIVSRYLLPRVMGNTAMVRNRELLILLAVVIALGATYAAHLFELSPAMGAFVAGILLAESPYAAQVRSDVGSLRTLFVTLFFVSIGMLGDPGWIAANWWAVALLVAAVVVGKAVVAAVMMRLIGYPWRPAAATGVCLAQVGEFSFVLAAAAAAVPAPGVEPLLSPDGFKLIVSATLATLFLTPYMVTAAPWVGDKVEALLGRKNSGAAAARSDALAACDEPGADPHMKPLDQHVIIVGFGPAGQRVGGALQALNHPTLVVDLKPANVEAARLFGLPAMIGDITSPDVLEHTHVAQASAVVITLPDHRIVLEVVHHVKAAAPHVAVIARARYHQFHYDIALAGASTVVDEEMLVGRQLGREVTHWVRSGRFSKPVTEEQTMWGTTTDAAMPDRSTETASDDPPSPPQS